MKTLFATVALAATVMAFPALAESSIGCKWEEPLSGSARSTHCLEQRFGDSRFIYSPMPLYGGASAFAYVPSRPLVLRRGMRNDRNSLQNETELSGGND
jgi:hypothetical protein